jgi:acetyl-CoA C-acetyltransferase
MTINGKAYIVGAYEHPTRKALDKSVAQIHAESAKGALQDAGLGQAPMSTAITAPAMRPASGPMSMADYMGLKCAMSTPPRPAARPTSCTSIARRGRR